MAKNEVTEHFVLRLLDTLLSLSATPLPSAFPILYTPLSLPLYSLSPLLPSVLQKKVVEQLRKDLLVKQEPEVKVQVLATDKHVLQIPSSTTLQALQQTTHTQALQQVATQVHRHCRPLLNCLLCCTKARCNFAVAYTRFAKFPRFS